MTKNVSGTHIWLMYSAPTTNFSRPGRMLNDRRSSRQNWRKYISNVKSYRYTKHLSIRVYQIIKINNVFFHEISHVKLNSWWCIMKLFQCSLHTMLCFLGIYEYIFTSYWYSKIIENLLYANPPVQREMHWKYFFIKLTMRYVRQKSYICALQYSLMRISHFTLYLKAKSKKTYLYKYFFILILC